MKKRMQKDEKLLNKIEKHLCQVALLDEYQERYIPYSYNFMDSEYYYILKISIFVITMIFHEYGIRIGIPILRRPDEVNMEDCDSWVYEDLFDFSFDLLCKFGWRIKEISCYGDINAKDIKKCINSLPDGKNEYFLQFIDIIEVFEKQGYILDYFAVLYFPGLGDLKTWFENHRKGNERLQYLYELCIKRTNCVFCDGFSNYKSININGTWYIPIIMGYNETNSSYDVSIKNLMMGRLFDTFVLSVVYDMARKRGYYHESQ